MQRKCKRHLKHPFTLTAAPPPLPPSLPPSLSPCSVFLIASLLISAATFVSYHLQFYVPLDFLEPIVLKKLYVLLYWFPGHAKAVKRGRIAVRVGFRTTLVIMTGVCVYICMCERCVCIHILYMCVYVHPHVCACDELILNCVYANITSTSHTQTHTSRNTLRHTCCTARSSISSNNLLDSDCDFVLWSLSLSLTHTQLYLPLLYHSLTTSSAC